MKIKNQGDPRVRGRQEQHKTSGQMRQPQKQKMLQDEENELASPQELGGQPGQQNAGSGQGKDSLNNFDIDMSGKKKPKI